MLYEVRIRAPLRGRYPQHVWLDALFKTPLEDWARDFTWRTADEFIYVRSINPRPGYWKPVEIPPAGVRIQFDLDAHVRRNRVMDVNGVRVTRRNRAVRDVEGNVTWLHRQAEMMGLFIERSTFQSQPEMIDKPERPFMMYRSQFHGTAIIIDQAAFEAKLITGVGNAKAFGFGFMAFEPI